MQSGLDRMQRAKMFQKKKKSLQEAKRFGDTRSIDKLPCNTHQQQLSNARERYMFVSSGSDSSSSSGDYAESNASFDSFEMVGEPNYVETLANQMKTGKNPNIGHLERSVKSETRKRRKGKGPTSGTLKDPLTYV